ncbi:hypothetical protein [Shimia sp.]|uniref:hypothetical protein n=1 Tax=Shimia sp. TaxID=1954381 RepID=UPI00329A6D83
MLNLKSILLMIFLPTLAMSNGSDIVADRFLECSALRDNPHEIHRCYFAVGDEVEREMNRAGFAGGSNS